MEKVDNLRQNVDKKAVLGIFAKYPEPGKVKTRLCPPLTAVEAAQLYTEALLEIVERLQGQDAYDLVLFYAGECSWFEQTFPGVKLLAQEGADLGRRMAKALTTLLGDGYDKAALIGSDSPDLPVAVIERAFTLLDQHELVIGPALDGGYYLIGESNHHPQLFSGIAWSSDQVLEQTRAKANQLEVRAGLLEPWEDLDDFGALQRYLERNPAGRTSRFMKQRLSQHFNNR